MKSIAIISTQAFSLINFRGSLVKCLVGQGVRVHALAPDFDVVTRAQVAGLGAIPVDIGFQRTGMNPLHDLWSMLMLARKLKSIQPDVVLAYFVKPVIYGMVASWLAGVPRRVAMIEGLGYVFNAQSKGPLTIRALASRTLRGVISQMYKLALARAHHVVFLNQDDVSEFVGDGLVDAKKVVMLGGIGVDLDEWRSGSVQTEPITFLLAARLLREKGIVEYARAARIVKSTYTNVRFILLGGLDTNPGALSGSEVASWVQEGILEWPGHVKVKSWLELTSVFVLPSYYREGLPRSTQEAMAMGRAVITTDAPGCRDTVLDGVNGYCVPVRDVDALVAAMTRFLNKPELITSMGLESRRMAIQKFDVRKIDARLIEILDLP